MLLDSACGCGSARVFVVITRVLRLVCGLFQVEYRKKYEQSKGRYHIALDTAEQLHHKENAVLHSQVSHTARVSMGTMPFHSVCSRSVLSTVLTLSENTVFSAVYK